MPPNDQSHDYIPTHPHLFEVRFSPGNFKSGLVATRNFAKGDLVASITTATPGPKRYTTVQVDKDKHIELNSDLVYMNHACDPTCFIDTQAMEVRAAKDIQAGEQLTFFYPSTEWDMDQPFQCWCKSAKCIGTVRGANSLPKSTLEQHFLNLHIKKLLDARESGLDV
ncbi:uncharacterized protein VTP21DRAFT_7146 [Calcarisporiella thermophila]|uniref:uncharacterized protein n=1 Tax=Calcarisporiella thermophila TaxID=911321 RepID=UPI003743CB7A